MSHFNMAQIALSSQSVSLVFKGLAVDGRTLQTDDLLFANAACIKIQAANRATEYSGAMLSVGIALAENILAQTVPAPATKSTPNPKYDARYVALKLVNPNWQVPELTVKDLVVEATNNPEVLAGYELENEATWAAHLAVVAKMTGGGQPAPWASVVEEAPQPMKSRIEWADTTAAAEEIKEAKLAQVEVAEAAAAELLPPWKLFLNGFLGR